MQIENKHIYYTILPRINTLNTRLNIDQKYCQYAYHTPDLGSFSSGLRSHLWLSLEMTHTQCNLQQLVVQYTWLNMNVLLLFY